MTLSASYFEKELKFPLSEWFKEIINTEIQLDGDQIEQANANLWSFSLNEEDKKKIDINDIKLLIESIISFMRETTCHLRNQKPILFYSWYDEMAGAIRTSCIHARIFDPLPFSSKVILTDKIDQICSKFLEGKDHIPFDELEADSDDWVELMDDDTTIEVYAEQL